MKHTVFKPIQCCGQLETERLFKSVSPGHCLYCGEPLAYESVDVNDSGDPIAFEPMNVAGLVDTKVSV